MLKIKAYANAQPIKYNSKNKATLDGWGLPRQTIYLNESNRRYHKLVDYKIIADYQTDFMDMVEGIIRKYPSWADSNDWGYAKLPKMYNDPVAYSINDLIKETKQHYVDAHDPTLSMLLRQKYLIRKLANDLGDPSIINAWDLDITFKNPHEPALKKFYDRNIFTVVAVQSSSYNDLFERK
jgi:hypothetical protein